MAADPIPSDVCGQTPAEVEFIRDTVDAMVGTTPGTIAAGDDSRFTDARTPTAHAASHKGGGTDVIATAVAGGDAGLMSGADKTTLDNVASTYLPLAGGTVAGRLRVYTATTADSTAATLLSGNSSSDKAVVIQAKAGQSVNLAEFQTSGGTARSYIDANGNLIGPIPINAQVGTTYTPALSDAGTLITLNNASAIVVTIDTNANVPYVNGTLLLLSQIGVGQVQIVPAGGVIINATPGLYLRDRYSGAALIRISTNSWLAFGDLST